MTPIDADAVRATLVRDMPTSATSGQRAESQPDPPRLYRSRDDRMLAGVASGIAHRVRVDPIVIRIAFVVTAFAGGLGVLVYALLWLAVPVAAPGQELALRHRPRRGALEVIAGSLILLGMLFLFRSVGFWLGDGLVWPALLAAIGIALLWQRASPERWATVRAELHELRERRLPPAVAELLGRGAETARLGRPDVPTMLRLALGAALVFAGIGAFAAANDAFAAARDGIVAMVIVLGGLLLIFGPWAWRLARDLAAERGERIRSQERAELAAHLHDSVLQTLTLIQRNGEDAEQMVQLARRQKRELRRWLYGDSQTRNGASVAAAIERAAGEVEDLHGVEVEAVAVGDCAVDEDVAALLGAAREAMVNSASCSGDRTVAVYLEVEPSRVTCFVRDRGRGFELASIPADPKGLSESILGRMRRHGGSATIRTAPGEGTEVDLMLPRPVAEDGADRP